MNKKGFITKRDVELLELIAQGFSIKEMVDHTRWTFGTIETYRVKLLRKFEARNAPHLVSIAYQRGILKAPQMIPVC